MSDQPRFGGIHIDSTTGEAVSNKPSSLAPAPGSLPVSSASVLSVVAICEEQAKSTDRSAGLCEAAKIPDWAKQERYASSVWRYCAEVLRRHAASMTERQPEENRT
jgi:hypothetical protein